MTGRPVRAIKSRRLDDYYYPQRLEIRRNAQKENEKEQKREKQNGRGDLQSQKTKNERKIPKELQKTQKAPALPSPQVETANLMEEEPQQVTQKKTFEEMTPLEIIDKIYSDPKFPSAYSADLKKYLLSKESLSRHKRIIRKFKRRRVFSSGPYDSVQADLIFYKQFSRQNEGYKYILSVVDTFSRKNYVRALRTATAEETGKALNDIFESMPVKPTKFSSDKGSEFSPSHPEISKILVDKFGMIIFQLKEPLKASMVERFNRTLKERIQRYFTENNTHKWIDVLQKLSHAINESVNRDIGMPPNKVNFENRDIVWKRLYGSVSQKAQCKYNVGDLVRIPVRKNIFEKGYLPNWTSELFKIKSRHTDGSVCYYTLENLSGEELDRKFYNQEINLVLRNDNESTAQ